LRRVLSAAFMDDRGRLVQAPQSLSWGSTAVNSRGFDGRRGRAEDVT
jgi:hypothetical protein